MNCGTKRVLVVHEKLATSPWLCGHFCAHGQRFENPSRTPYPSIRLRLHAICHKQWLKYKIRGGGSVLISGPLRDPADISRCIVDVNWAPDLSIVKFLGPGTQIRQDPSYFNQWPQGMSLACNPTAQSTTQPLTQPNTQPLSKCRLLLKLIAHQIVILNSFVNI